MQHTNSVQEMWRAYLNSLGEDPTTTDKAFVTWHFSDNERDANELAALVKAGRKRATASAHWTYEFDHEPLPRIGDHSVITNWDGEAQCVVRTTSVKVVPFNKVTAEFAWAEGEGDRSLAYWRAVHWAVFSRDLEAIGKSPEETMLVVCETFDVVHALPKEQ